MNKRKATVRQVADDSFLILVDGYPVHQTEDAAAARLLARRLQRLLRDARRLESVLVRATEGRYELRARVGSDRAEGGRPAAELVLLELSDGEDPLAWLHASVVAENIRDALQRQRPEPQTQFPDVVPLNPTPHQTTAQPTTTTLNPSNPSPEEHLPQLDTVLRKLPTEQGTVYLYTKRYDRENVHAGLVTEERSFDLSPISTMLNWELTTAAVVHLLREPVPFLRIQGVMGANTVKNLYFRMENKFPVPVIEVDGNVYEIDLDNDGNKEVILVSGIPKLTIVYSWAEERFQEVNVNLTLKSKSTQLNPDTNLIEVFTAVPETGGTVSAAPEEIVTYRYERDRLVKVPTAQTSAQAPAQTPAQAPAQTPAQAPAQTPAQVPAQTSAQAPAQTSAQVPAQTSAQAPAQTSTQTPAQTSTQAPAQTSAQTPAQAPTPPAIS